jgi:hypothetical protein
MVIFTATLEADSGQYQIGPAIDGAAISVPAYVSAYLFDDPAFISATFLFPKVEAGPHSLTMRWGISDGSLVAREVSTIVLFIQ